jgi:hypothetical protein
MKQKEVSNSGHSVGHFLQYHFQMCLLTYVIL